MLEVLQTAMRSVDSMQKKKLIGLLLGVKDDLKGTVRLTRMPAIF